MTEEFYMRRCLELATLGLGNVAPNPLVGSVIVHNDRIIGEGYHMEYGMAHAEVNAINNVVDPTILKDSTLYVNLEPCCHHGKTPPCTDLIIQTGIKQVVIGSVDLHHVVAGKGISRLRNAGCEVKTGVLKNESYNLNRRFFTFHEKRRPYIILKWAQSADSFIDFERKPGTAIGPNWITSKYLRILVHKWRSEEQAIMVGTNTARLDNPRLNTRLWPGKSPIRIIIDPDLDLPADLNVFDDSQKTIIVNQRSEKTQGNTTWHKTDCSDTQMIPKLMHFLYEMEIQSVIIEGGRVLLQNFIDQGFWDEARVFTGSRFFAGGIRAPLIAGNLDAKYEFQNESLCIFRKK